MKPLLFLILLVFANITHSQNVLHEKISFTTEYAHHQYAMDSLNKHFLDYMILDIERLDDYITSGKNFQVSFNYRPDKLFDFGLRMGYQFANTSKTSNTTIWGQNPEPMDTEVYSFFRVSSQNINFQSALYMNEVARYLNINFLPERINFLLDASIGLAFNRTYGYSHFLNPLVTSFSNSASATVNKSINSTLGLRIEFRISQKPILSHLGIKCGYQFFNTGVLKLKSGEEVKSWEGYPTNLDFSGFYYGIYLKFGK